ncbi:efflux transporter outer membrane subunit [Sphingomonas sp.]|uniref:efflux transporter outer membrane subunit n=1 Tax=Sphingomonas sp. TaxID=28214 RepID=UPI0025F21110|nr:efflux transporter outer membrane subunit [Sphingomonas sp.]
MIAATALALAGCTVGPNYARPEMAVPARYAGIAPAPAPGQGIDPARWWTGFGDQRLNALIDKALTDNPDMAMAASRVRQARLQEIVARAQGKPQVNADANVSHVEFSRNAGLASLGRLFAGGTGTGQTGAGIAPPGGGVTTYALGFDASWELDLFGGARRGVEAARARIEAAEWTRRDAAVTIAAEVADAYFALRLDQAQIALIESEIAKAQRSIEIAHHQASAGLTPSIDAIRARGALTQAQARIEPLRADADIRIHALGILTGQPPEALLDDLRTPGAELGEAPAVPVGLPADLLRRRPDVRAAERRLAAATADIGVQVANLYPRVNLTALGQLLSAGLTNFVSQDSGQLVGSSAISFPLLDWGRRRAGVKIAREAREQAYIDYQATVLRALRDVEDPLTSLATERRRNAVLRQSLADATRSAQAVAARHQAGMVAQDAVLLADIQQLAAREQVAASDALLRQQTAALFKAIGGGWGEEIQSAAR